MAYTDPPGVDRRPGAPAATTVTTTSRFGAIDIVAIVLMIVGGLNWGLLALFNFDLVAALFGAMTLPSRIVYGLVALAALYGIAIAVRMGRRETRVVG